MRKSLNFNDLHESAIWHRSCHEVDDSQGLPLVGSPVQRPSESQEKDTMKKIEAIIKPFAAEKVREALNKAGVTGMTLYEVKGFGRQKGHSELYRGAEYQVDFLPKLKIEVIIPDDKEDSVVEAITSSASTGKIGDGKVFVSEVTKAVRIRTREINEQAL
jgi:nitrogen regulatory protein P-II 1